MTRPTPGKPLRVVHTSLRVLDPDASVAFYRELGFEVRGHLSFPDRWYVYMGLPGHPAQLELGVERGRTEPYDLGDGYRNVAIAIEDLDAFLARVAATGIVPAEPPLHPVGHPELRVCFINDPDGYAIELIDGDYVPPNDPIER